MKPFPRQPASIASLSASLQGSGTQQPLSSSSENKNGDDVVEWLLDAMEGGFTLPPLEVLLESSMFRRGGAQAGSHGEGGTLGRDRDRYKNDQNLALESFHEWAMSLEASSVAGTAASPGGGKGSKERRISGGMPAKKPSPYTAHQRGSGGSAPPDPPISALAPVKARKKQTAAARGDTLQTYLQFLRGTAPSQQGDPNLNPNPNPNQQSAADNKNALRLAIAAHISKEASASNRNKMGGRAGRPSPLGRGGGGGKRDVWSTIITCPNTFEEMARERERDELAQQVCLSFHVNFIMPVNRPNLPE